MGMAEHKRDTVEPKIGKVEVLQPSTMDSPLPPSPGSLLDRWSGGRPITPVRDEDCASPPRMEIKQEDVKDVKEKITPENDFHVADSIKNSFRDPHHFELIKNMIEGVNKTTTKQMFGEAVNTDVKNEWEADDDQCDESIAGSEDGGNNIGVQDDRKVRVRTLISEEQSLILKTHYQCNPRPKREELDAIARKIGHPFKVVKVWFQNARARDRREGKNLPHLPFPTNHAPFLNNNFQFANLPRLPLPFMRPGLPEHFNKLNPLFNFTNLQNLGLGRDESKSPDSIKSDNIDDEMEEEEEVPLDLSNKGSTPGASPSNDKEDQFNRQSINFSKLGASFSNSSSDEEDLPLTVPTAALQENKLFSKKNSLNKHLLDNKGRI